jgi:hypothetical protein
LQLLLKLAQLFIQVFYRQLQSFNIFLIFLQIVEVNIPEVGDFLILENGELLNSLVHEIEGLSSNKIHVLILPELLLDHGSPLEYLF